MQSFQLLNYHQPENTDQSWKFVCLYGHDQKGKKRQWQIGFDAESHELVTVYGQVEGKLREVRKLVKLNKSGRNYYSQSILEASKKHKDKLVKDKYTEDGSNTTLHLQAANHYDPQKTVLKFPVAVQPKLNGKRCRVYIKGQNVILESRGGEMIKYYDHIREEAQILLQKLPKETELDGELYLHTLSFNKLQSIFQTENFEHPHNRRIQFHIFDLISKDIIYNERHQLLVKAFENTQLESIILNSMKLVSSHQEIKDQHDRLVEQGYEGLIIRHWYQESMTSKERELCLYKGKRNNNWLKYKCYLDEEGIIEGVYEGEGTEKGLALFVIRDKQGIQVKARPRGTFEQRRDWFQNQGSVIGKTYTFRYFSRSDKGVPEQPTGVGFRGIDDLDHT